MPQKLLKSSIANFYDAETISKALDTLSSNVDAISIGIDGWKRPAKRRCTAENRPKIEIDDLFIVVQFIDEHSLWEKVPKYVAYNLNNIPACNLQDGDYKSLLTKLDSVSDKLDTIVDYTQSAAVSRNVADAGHTVMTDHRINWAEPRDMGGSVDGDSVTSGDCLAGDDLPFSHILSRKQRRQIAQSARLSSATTTAAADVHSKPSAPSRPPPTVPRPHRPLTVRGTNDSCTLKAAKEIYKKKVFCVSNLSCETSCDTLKEYLTTLNVRVFSVFEAKSKYSESAAFRVCVDATDVQKFADAGNWGSHVIIREWVHKPRQ